MTTRMNRLRILDAMEAASPNGKEMAALRNPHTGCMCFQGVIVDEYLKAHGEEWVDGFMVEGDSGHLLSAWAPKRVLAWSGFSEKEIAQYTALNDDVLTNLTLGQLARIIRTMGELE